MEIEKMEFNMFKLKIHVGSSENDYDLFILGNEDDELVRSLNEPKDEEASSSRLTLLRKLIGAGNIEHHVVPNKEEKGIHRRGAHKRSKKQTWGDISEKWREKTKNIKHDLLVIVKPSTTIEHSKVANELKYPFI